MLNVVISLLAFGLLLPILMEKRHAVPVPIKIEKRDPGH